MLHDVSLLEDNKRKNYYNLRQSYLRKLLRMKANDLIGLDDNDKEPYTIKFDVQRQKQFILIAIDHFNNVKKDSSIEDMELKRFSIVNIAEELCNKHYPCECIDMQSDHLVLVFNREDQSHANYSQLLKSLCVELQETISELLKLKTSLVIGPKNLARTSMNALYNESLYALDYRLVYGYGSVIDYEEIADKGLEPYEMDLKRLKKLVETVVSGKTNEAISQYDEMLIDALECTADSIRHLHIQIAFALNDNLMYIKSQGDYHLMELDQLLRAITDSETIADIKELFMSHFESIGQLIGGL